MKPKWNQRERDTTTMTSEDKYIASAWALAEGRTKARNY